jgi:hypothetical protein
VTKIEQARPWRPESFEEWVKFAPTDYLLCWDGMHPFDDKGWRGESVEWQVDGSCMLYQVCPRCGLPRDRYIGPGGEIDGRQNVYYYHRMEKHPYPYLFHDKGKFAPDIKNKRRRIRVELRRRLTEGQPVPRHPKSAAEIVRHVEFRSA